MVGTACEVNCPQWTGAEPGTQEGILVRLTRVAVLVSAALLPMSSAACAAGAPSADRSPIVIGADLELSGAYAAIGTAYQQALQLRIEQLNAQGGVDGRHLVLTAKDNHSDPVVSVGNVQGFASEPDIAALITGVCSACFMSVAKTVEDKQLPTVSLAPASAVARPVADRRYVFKVAPNADDSAAALAIELHGAGVHTVGVLSTDSVDGTDAQAAISAVAPKVAAEVVSRQVCKVTDTDLTQPVRAALQKHPDALVVAAFPDQATLAAKSAREAGYDGRIFFDATAAGDLFLTGPGAGGAEGAIMVAPQTLVIDDVIATTPAKTARKRWFDDYTSRYGTFTGYSTYAADAVRLIADAVRTAGGPDHGKMRDVMEDSAFDGLSGQIRFTPDNHSGMMPQGLTAVVARSGRWRLLS
jgi:branched-chain amino acid transport system substrate-binding protein